MESKLNEEKVKRDSEISQLESSLDFMKKDIREKTNTIDDRERDIERLKT